MDATEKGAYIMLLISHYQVGSEGLPDDDKQLARIAGVSGKVWSRIRPIMAAKFSIKNGFWVNSKTVEVLQKVAQLRSQNSAKALKRFTPPNATAMPQQCQPKPKPKPNIISKDIIDRPADVSQSVWDDFVRHRKGVKAPLTSTALAGIAREAVKAGVSLEDAMREMCARGWRGFKAEWINKEKANDGKLTTHERLKLAGDQALDELFAELDRKEQTLAIAGPAGTEL